MNPQLRSRRKASIIAASLGTAMVIAYAVWAAVQILWWNPLAAVPGLSYEQILAEMADAKESLMAPTAIVVLSIGPVAALLLLVMTLRAKHPNPLLTALIYLGILALGVGAYFIASFGPGMSLADTFMISGADYAPNAWLLYVTSALALIAAFVLAIVGAARGWSTPIEEVSAAVDAEA